MNSLIVKIWGEELGRLIYDPAKRITYFMFNPDAENRPDVAPLSHPVGKGVDSLPVYSDDRRIYQGLPPFIADSLPDAWGNRVMEQWIRKNKIPRNRVTPLYKLMFIGRRGMGALEFEPSSDDLMHTDSINLHELYQLSLSILEDRESILISNSNLTLNSLLAAGTSAGGRQMKAIVAVNTRNGTVKSGQAETSSDYEHFIIKFEDSCFPSAEIEMAFYRMAIDAGIEMTDSKLIEVDGKKHFMTMRFDRKGSDKIHLQTLAAINPEANSYEDIFSTMRKLNLSNKEIHQMFRRLVFNVMANNTDDHNKNISFLLPRKGLWQLAPAYDVTFIFNNFGNDRQWERCCSLAGKLYDITKKDLLDFATENNIRNPDKIISDVANALLNFDEWADKYGIPGKWRYIISRTIRDNLVAYGYLDNAQIPDFTDSDGNLYSEISIRLNQRGDIEISTLINQSPKRGFIHKHDINYEMFQSLSNINNDIDKIHGLIKSIFQ